MEEYLDLDDEENDPNYLPSEDGVESESEISMTSEQESTRSTLDGTFRSLRSATSDSISPADSRSQVEVGRSTPSLQFLRRGGTVTTESSNRSMSTTSETESVFRTSCKRRLV